MQVIEAGANAIVAGSAVFGAKDYAEGMDATLFSEPYIFVFFKRYYNTNYMF